MWDIYWHTLVSDLCVSEWTFATLDTFCGDASFIQLQLSLNEAVLNDREWHKCCELLCFSQILAPALLAWWWLCGGSCSTSFRCWQASFCVWGIEIGQLWCECSKEDVGVPLPQASCWDSYNSRESSVQCNCIMYTVNSSMNLKAGVQLGLKKPLAALCSVLISSASQSYLRPEAIVVQAGVQWMTYKKKKENAGANLCCRLHISGGPVAFFSSWWRWIIFKCQCLLVVYVNVCGVSVYSGSEKSIRNLKGPSDPITFRGNVCLNGCVL